MGEGEYVPGIEPCNCYVGGRLDPRNKDSLEYPEPGERKNFDVEIEIVTGSHDIHALEVPYILLMSYLKTIYRTILRKLSSEADEAKIPTMFPSTSVTTILE